MTRLFWAFLALAAVWAFDHAMQADRANLCGNDLTAYSECSE